MINSSRTYVFITAVVTLAVILGGCGGDSGTVIYQNISERTAWGPDGTIAFASYGGNGQLYVYRINEQGGGLVLLTPSDDDDDFSDEGGRQPAYSPSGEQIAIVSRRSTTPAIYLMGAIRGDRDGLTAVTSAAGTGADTEPSFTPDGSQIVFTSTRGDGNPDIRIIGTDGSGNAALVETAAEEHWGVVSPDGSTLAYQSDANGNTDIWVKDMSAAADDPGTCLTAGSPFRDEAPAWSPDGTQIAFHSNRNGDFDIFMMNADGSGQVEVTADQRSDGYPVFNPAGGRLVITRDREIWTIPAQPWSEWSGEADTLSEQLTRRY